MQSFHSLWSQLSSEQRTLAARALWLDGHEIWKQRAAHELGELRKTRPKTILAQPLDQRIRRLADAAALPESVCGDLLRSYMFALYKPMMAHFLDKLGVDHKDCVIADENLCSADLPPAETIRRASSELVSIHGIQNVRMYFSVLQLREPILWQVLSGIDLDNLKISEPSTESPISISINAESENENQQSLDGIGVDELSAQIDILLSRFSQASGRLSEIASALAHGDPQESADLGFLSECRSLFGSIRNRTCALAKLYDVAVDEAGLTNAGTLRTAANAIGEAAAGRDQQSKKRKRLLEIISDINLLSRSDGTPCPPLVDCQKDAADYSERLQGEPSPPEGEALVHTFEALLDLVNKRLDPSDDGESLVELVTQRYGLKLPILALQGKLVIRERSESPKENVVEKTDDAVLGSQHHNNEIFETTEASPLAQDGANALLETDVSTLDEASKPVAKQNLQDVHLVEAQASDISPRSPEQVTPEVVATMLCETSLTLDDLAPNAEDLNESPVHYLPVSRTAANATELAKTLVATDDLSKTAATELVFHLLQENYSGLAYQLARVAAPELSAELLRAVVLGPHVRDHSGTIARELAGDFETLIEHPPFEQHSPERNRAMRFLVCAASLPAALLAPNTGACDVFRSINFEDGFRHLWKTGKAVVEYAEVCRSFDISVLGLACSESDWSDRLSSLQTRVEEWYERAVSKRFIFGPAGDVWRKWLETGQLIHRLLAPVRRDEVANLKASRAELDRLGISINVRQEIEHADRQVLHRHGASITARAFSQLTRRLQQEVLDLLREWIILHQNSPKHVGDFRFNQTNNLRNTILGERNAVLKELIDFKSEHEPSLSVCSALTCCQRSFEQVYALLEQPVSLNEAPLRYVLNSDLLRVCGLPLDENWRPEGADEKSVAKGILAAVATGGLDWFECLRQHSATDLDHQATERILEYLAVSDVKMATLDAMHEFRRKEIAKCNGALERGVAETQNAVEYGIALGVIGESDRNALLARVEMVATGVPKSLLFGEGFRRLKQIRNDLDGRREIAAGAARRRLANSTLPKDSDSYLRISRVLDAGDPVTAVEYIDRALAGDDLPTEHSSTSRFHEFLQAYGPLAEFLSKITDSEIVSAVRNRKYVAGFAVRHLDERQAEESADALEAWFTAKRQSRPRMSEKQCATIFRALGFDVLTIDQHTTESHKRTWFMVQTNLVADRERCPVAAFGSSAKGNYRVLCVWGEPPEEDILKFVGETQGIPGVVFYFGVLTAEQRQNITRMCRDQHKTVVILDDILFVWVCMERPPRMPVFFELALPYTYLEPYTPTAGLVAPELFFGRRREVESVLSPLGSCFIYGGRQLGKTALLRAVERNSHSPAEGRFVCWVDLKAHGLGFNRSIEEIWPLLTKSIRDKDSGIIPAKFSSHADPDKIFAVLKQWLDADTSRRILLLLDEADRFLESDATSEFTHVIKLKDWMETTDRRFKVVFAGLHNVQRTTRQANNPLAHFGEPICIGPLLENGEWREARALVERPLESMGFHFESPDLVTRILSQTNYFPSLIQIYCSQLLRYFGKKKFEAFQHPPYTITSRQIEDAYKNQQIRSDIRDRLRWTLDLDKRYRVVTYAIAFAIATGEETEGRVDEGYSVQWIRDQALSIWRKGFKDSQSIDEIASLLAEMVGLGVLREEKSHPGFFSLRSPNVMNVLGTVDEIFGELEAAADFEPQPSYERDKFRNGLPDDTVRRNPLTAAQESEIRAPRNGAAIIFGTEAAGLSDVPDFLKHAVGPEFFQPLVGVSQSHNEYLTRLNALSKREVDATTVAYVSPLAPWNELWVRESVARISKFRTSRNFVRAVFAADPQITWYLTASTALLSMTEGDVKSQSLGPWHNTALQQWLDSYEVTNADARNRIAEVTGRWPLLLYRMFKLAKNNSNLVEAVEKLDAEMQDADIRRTLEESFGLIIAEPRRVLVALSQYGAALAPEEIAQLIEPAIPMELIKRSIVWADRLRLINAAGQGCWEVDPTVAQVLGFRRK